MILPVVLGLAQAAAVVAPVGDSDRGASIERAIYEICPLVWKGEIDLTDAVQLAQLGLAPAPSSAAKEEVRASWGEGDRRVFVSRGGASPCTVTFGGPDNDEMHGRVMARARALGLKASVTNGLGMNMAILQPRNPKKMGTFSRY